MKSFSLQTDGSIEEKEISKNELLKKYENLNIRDLRPVFSPLQVATILPRLDVLIVNLGFVKAIIANDSAHFLTFDVDDKTRALLNNIVKELKNEGEDFKRVFYLRVLENILDTKTKQLNKKIHNFRARTDNVLAQVTKHFSKEGLENLLALKKKISRLEIRIKEIQSAIDEILDEDESFNQLVQIGGGSEEDRLEVESILENSVEQIEDNLGNTQRISEDIEDTEEYLALRVDHFRNRIIKMDLIATAITLVFAMLAVVVGLYGMNIKNGFETSINIFRLFRDGIIIFSVISILIIIFLFNKKDLL